MFIKDAHQNRIISTETVSEFSFSKQLPLLVVSILSNNYPIQEVLLGGNSRNITPVKSFSRDAYMPLKKLVVDQKLRN